MIDPQAIVCKIDQSFDLKSTLAAAIPMIMAAVLASMILGLGGWIRDWLKTRSLFNYRKMNWLYPTMRAKTKDHYERERQSYVAGQPQPSMLDMVKWNQHNDTSRITWTFASSMIDDFRERRDFVEVCKQRGLIRCYEANPWANTDGTIARYEITATPSLKTWAMIDKQCRKQMARDNAPWHKLWRNLRAQNLRDRKEERRRNNPKPIKPIYRAFPHEQLWETFGITILTIISVISIIHFLF